MDDSVWSTFLNTSSLYSSQMSGAKAVGVTSRQNVPKEETEEDRQKKELARALFGGMQRSMVISNVSVAEYIRTKRCVQGGGRNEL